MSDGIADPLVEAKALAHVVEALKGLNPAGVRKIIRWLSDTYTVQTPGGGAARTGGGAAMESDGKAVGEYKDMAALFVAAAPKNGPEYALVAGYWHQCILGKQNFDGTINSELKNLGRQLANVTKTLTTLMELKPALVIQVGKSGNSKQARKQYRLTTAGVGRVKAMLNGESEKGDDA